MKDKIVISSLIIFALIVALGAQIPNCVYADTEFEQHKVVVMGKGELYIAPNEATINLALETKGTEVTVAQTENVKKFNSVKEVLNKYNIDKKNIKTLGYNVYKDYNYIKLNTNLQGYIVTNSISIKINDLSILGNIISNLIESGINNINHISFSYSNYEELYLQALKQAMSNAKIKATALTGNENLTLLEVCEEGTYSNRAILYSNYESLKSTADTSTIYGGELAISANVRVVYTF